MFFRSLTRFSLCVLAVALATDGASGHAYPDLVSPADGATLTQPPAEVRIKFTEGVELEFSRVEVKNAAGQRVSKGNVTTRWQRYLNSRVVTP